MLEVYWSRNRRAVRLRQAVAGVACAAVAAGLGGCAGRSPIDAGADLFHGLEGGAIAEQRPPPPGADAPYPSIGTIPQRPGAPDVLAQQRIADQLATQRDAATTAANNSPLTALPPTPAPPKPAVLDPNANRVVVDAAASPTPPPGQPPVVPAAAGIDSVPAVPAAVASGPLPSFAAGPPTPAVGLGVVLGPPAPTAAAPVPPPQPAPGGAVTIVFTPGSATLPPSAPLNLRRFALAHRGAAVTITGKGEAVLPNPDAQARALDLGLRRAQAIAAALASAGVAAANLHLRAQAAGQGGTASL